MAMNLHDSLMNLMTPELMSAMAAGTGESEGAVSKGLTAGVPLVLAGLLQKSSDPGAMDQVMNLLSNRANNPDLLRNPKAMLSGDGASTAQKELGGSLLSALFGRDLGAVTTGLGQQAGVASTSASSIMTLVASLLAALLGNRMRTGGLNLSGLLAMLNEQRDGILRALPAVLSSIGGLGALRGLAGGATRAVREAEPRHLPGWLWAAAALLVVLVGGWAMWGTGTAPDMKAPSADVARQADQMARSAGQAASGAVQQAGQAAGNAAQQGQQLVVASLGPFFSRRLPTNVELNIPQHGVEAQFITFLDDPSKQTDPAVWFNFDRLLFETGSATLKPASQEQLKNVAEILKAYPSVTIKIGGYTDNVGDPAGNLKLSQDRATNVMATLVALGVNASRMSAEGYGEQNPVADNTTEDGRAQNRRIAMRVTEK